MPWRLPLRQVLPANVSRLRRANVRGACTNLRHPGLGSPASPSRYFCLVFRLRRLAMNCATPTAIISSKKTKSQIMLLLSTFFSFCENVPQPGRQNRLPRRTTSESPAAAASRSSFPRPCRDRGGGPVLCAGRMTRRLAQERLILSRGGRKFPWEKEVNGGGNRGRS